MPKEAPRAISDEEAAASISAAALAAARLAAAIKLTDDLRASGIVDIGATPTEVSGILTSRDRKDPRYAALAPWEQQWALLVVQFAAAAAQPVWLIDRQAVEEARDRGITWQAIADTLGLSQQTAHARYGSKRK